MCLLNDELMICLLFYTFIFQHKLFKIFTKNLTATHTIIRKKQTDKVRQKSRERKTEGEKKKEKSKYMSERAIRGWLNITA